VRKKWVVANWKMHTTASTARQLAADVVKGVGGDDRVGVALCPPFPFLPVVADVLRGSPVLLGAQDCYCEKEGAFTGEVSPWMLADVGCHFVIVGHSERRHKLGEGDELINRKVRAALDAGLITVLCVGETLAEREAKRVESVLLFQFDAGLSGLTPEHMKRVILAYEPVWAIGTGKNATPEQAQEVHELLRKRATLLFGEDRGRELPMLYGGSIKPDNARSLLTQPDIDGGLVGGASLKAADFLAIVKAGLPA
jgi:triosephosphate isomerase